jgi:threonine aldolase
MRQIGLLAGCAAYALNHNFPQLPRVHAIARKLEAGLRELGAQILVQTLAWYVVLSYLRSFFSMSAI